MLEIGQLAPDFTLPDETGTMHSLRDFRGGKVALYFYPKDNTPACTSEAQAFTEMYGAFVAHGVTIIGISRDTQASHRKFKDAFALPFLLLSDTALEAIHAYDVWQQKTMYGKTVHGGFLGLGRSELAVFNARTQEPPVS